ncbi:transcriptional repressor [Shigella flexneri]
MVTRHISKAVNPCRLTRRRHHDHLICLDYGKVLEFSDDWVESRHVVIAASRHSPNQP